MKKYATLAVFFRAFFVDEQTKPRKVEGWQYPELANSYTNLFYGFNQRLIFDSAGYPWLLPIDPCAPPWQDQQLKGKELRFVPKEQLPKPLLDHLLAQEYRRLGFVEKDGQFILPEKKERKLKRESNYRAQR